MSAAAAAAVAVGAATGALVRWRVSLWLNQTWAAFPLGTLVINLVGGLLIGISLALLERAPHDLARLLLVTGFLGGMTTFSAFSGESLALLLRGQWAWAVAHTLAHVLGALACCGLGYAAIRAVFNG